MTATFKLAGTGSGAVRAVQDLNKALDGTEKGFKGTAAEAKKLETAAGRVVKANEAPLERYNRRVKETAELVAKGKLGHEQAAVAVQRFGVQLDKAERRQRSAFGVQALSRITTFVGGLAGIHRSIAVVVDGFRQIDAEGQAAADSLLQRLGGIGELQQLAGGDPNKLRTQFAFANRLIREGVVPANQQQLAEQITFSAFSDALSKQERDFLVRIGREGIIRPEGLAQFSGSVGQVKRGTGFQGSLTELSNKVLSAAAGTPKVSAQEFATAATKFSTEARTLGIPIDEQLAALQVAGQKTGIDVASTQLKALFTAIDVEGLNQGTLGGTLAEIERRVEAGENLRGIIGSSIRAVGGFRLLSQDPALLSQFQQSIGSAPDVVGQDLLRTADRRVGATVLRKRAESALADATDTFGSEREALFDALRAERRRVFIEQGGGAITTGAGKLLGGTIDFFNLEESAFNKALSTPEIRSQLSPDLLGQLTDYMRRTAEASEETRDTVTRPVPGGRQE